MRGVDTCVIEDFEGKLPGVSGEDACVCLAYVSVCVAGKLPGVSREDACVCVCVRERMRSVCKRMRSGQALRRLKGRCLRMRMRSVRDSDAVSCVAYA
jgi:hypothetical protein